jgi:hypothetical protein
MATRMLRVSSTIGFKSESQGMKMSNKVDI